MEKMSFKTICASIIFTLFFGFGGQKLFHKQYAQWIIYFLSSNLFSLGNFIDVLEFIFDPNFLLLSSSNKLVNKYRKIELIVKSILAAIFFGVILFAFYTWIYTIRNIYNLGIYIPIIFIIIGLISNSLVLIFKCCCCNDNATAKSEEDNEQLPDKMEDILDESSYVTPKRIYKHVLIVVVGFTLWLIVIILAIALGSESYKTLISNDSYYKETLKWANNINNTIEYKYLNIGDYSVIQNEYNCTINDTLYKYIVFSPNVSNSNDFPVVFISNPENARYSEYIPLFKRLASWGYHVVGNEEGKNSYKGEILSEIIKNFSLRSEFPKEQKIGIVGYGLGASGVLRALTNYKQNLPNITSIYLSELHSNVILTRKGGEYSYNIQEKELGYLNILVGAAGGMFSELTMSKSEWVNEVDPLIQHSSYSYGYAARLKGIGSGALIRNDDGIMTGWFELTLKGNKDAETIFNTELANKDRWIDTLYNQ